MRTRLLHYIVINVQYPEEQHSLIFSARTLGVQGDANQHFSFQMAVPLKQGTSDPVLVKPKCV